MIVADTLSRLPNPINKNDVDLDVRVDGLALEADDPQNLTIALNNFPTAKQQLWKEETLRDPILNGLRMAGKRQRATYGPQSVLVFSR